MSVPELSVAGRGEGRGRRRLSDVVARRRGDIVTRFVAAIREGDVAPDGATRSQIVDHVPSLLDEMAASFAGVEEGAAGAPEHGRQRWEIGYRLDALIKEYEILRRIIGDVAAEEHADLGADEGNALSTWLADHVAAAATAYSAYRDDELARERDRLAFLAEAGRLLTSSLDPRAVLARLARLVVPRLADWCVVHRVDGDGADLIGVTHVDPAKEDALRRLCGGWRSDDAPFGAPAAMKSGRATRIEEVPAGLLEAQAASPEERALVAELGCRSWLAVPLTVQSSVLGALVLASSDSGRRYGALDEALAEEVAMRAAVAIENGRLYELSQEARARMEESARAKDEFLAVVSHELRTPLTAILGWAAILRSGTLSPEQLRHGLEVIERNARAESQIVSDLLDINRLVGGHLRIDFAPLDVAAAVAQAVEGIRPAAMAKDIELAVAVEAEGTIVRGDAGRLAQIVWNLVTNAVKFTPKGGHITVSIARRGSDVALVVADDGIGISERFMPHLFESFRQSDAGAGRAHGGLGVGLWLVRQLVELHGGSVRAASAGSDRGSQFTVLLPASPL